MAEAPSVEELLDFEEVGSQGLQAEAPSVEELLEFRLETVEFRAVEFRFVDFLLG